MATIVGRVVCCGATSGHRLITLHSSRHFVYIARVVGDVIATHRHANLGGHKLLLVRRLGLDGSEEGGEVIALDVIGVGVGERVLIVQEGNAARSLSTTPAITA